jgi:hypothetical protein
MATLRIVSGARVRSGVSSACPRCLEFDCDEFWSDGVLFSELRVRVVNVVNLPTLEPESAHQHDIREYGEDLPEIREWRWRPIRPQA